MSPQQYFSYRAHCKDALIKHKIQHVWFGGPWYCVMSSLEQISCKKYNFLIKVS